MSHGHARRESTHWYGMLAYLAVGVFGLAYSAFQYNEGLEIGASITMSVVLLVLVFGGVATYWLLFKDAMYLSRTGHRWTPTWWMYAGAGLGVPALIYFGGDALAPSSPNSVVALLVYTLLTVGVNVVYLYRRHKYIGRP